jgi:N-acetylglucosamine-6-phosphate deacetylase
MARAVRNTVETLGVSIAEAAHMATAYPADFLRIGNQRGRIATGLRADLVELGADFEVVRTWPD